jgi:magnesium transporter
MTGMSEPSAPRPRLRIIHYDAETLDDVRVDSVEECRSFLAKPGVTWIDLDDKPDIPTMEAFQKLLDLHPLAVADATGTFQRAKHDAYGKFDLLVLRMVHPSEPGLRLEQVCLYVGDNWVLTVQSRPGGDAFEPARQRLSRAGKIRRCGADYLAYAIVDAIVDGFFPVIESYGDRLEALEDAVLGPLSKQVVRYLHSARRDLLTIRRAVWPLRDAIGELSREEQSRFTDTTKVYLRDVYDHTIQCIDLVETHRELAASLVELHLAAVGFRTNEVMKILTIFSTIFLPLTFIAGVYGMNFDTKFPANMPELRWEYGYQFSLALMGLCALGLIWFFKRKGWIGREPDLDLDTPDDDEPEGEQPRR